MTGAWFRLTWHLSAFATHIIAGLLLALLLRIFLGQFWFTLGFGSRVRQWWMQILAGIIGLQISTTGKAALSSTVYVANHISWLDIVAISACTPTAFVAKSSLKHWPVLGQLMWLSGTLFIDRLNKRELINTIQSFQSILANGGSVSFFPESTTTDGTHVMPFRSGLFAAVLGQYPIAVQPIAIHYPEHIPGVKPIAPFIGDDTFVSHLIRVLRAKAIHVQLIFCETLPHKQLITRQNLAIDSRRQIIHQLHYVS